jgi:glycosyltransferase involved in cell wall biosynthesis
MTITTIDVLIPCYNEKKYLPALFESLNKLKIPTNMEIRYIFSDNASNDGTNEFLKNTGLKNKIVYTHEENLGGTNNLIFLLTKIQSDYFMYLDAHDFLTENYFYNFSEILNESICGDIYIGDVVTFKEIEDKFEIIELQDRFKLNNNPRLRQIQLALFLYHNSIYHSIIRKEAINTAFLGKSKTLTFDHVITHSALVFGNIRYLDGCFYVRRYRKILGADFTHDVNGRNISRYDRAAGFRRDLNDSKLSKIIGQICLLVGGRLYSTFISFLIKGKFERLSFNYIFFRVIRFISNRMFRLNPLLTQKRELNQFTCDEIYRYENFNF